MTHEEATARAGALNEGGSAAEHWLVSEATPGDWKVVRLSGPGITAPRPSGAHTESRPKPDVAEDPRPAVFRDVPPYGAG